MVATAVVLILEVPVVAAALVVVVALGMAIQLLVAAAPAILQVLPQRKALEVVQVVLVVVAVEVVDQVVLARLVQAELLVSELLTQSLGLLLLTPKVAKASLLEVQQAVQTPVMVAVLDSPILSIHLLVVVVL